MVCSSSLTTEISSGTISVNVQGVPEWLQKSTDLLRLEQFHFDKVFNKFHDFRGIHLLISYNLVTLDTSPHIFSLLHFVLKCPPFCFNATFCQCKWGGSSEVVQVRWCNWGGGLWWEHLGRRRSFGLWGLQQWQNRDTHPLSGVPTLGGDEQRAWSEQEGHSRK